jgi:hypothetical protein
MFESISFKGVDLLFSKFLVISLINTLNNVGPNESPCLTPPWDVKKDLSVDLYVSKMMLLYWDIVLSII